MKITYNFANENITIDVEDQWATVLIDLDREEYNANHRESRRHCSLEAFDADHNLMSSDDELIAEVIRSADAEKLHAAIRLLKPSYRELVYALYFEGISNEEYAGRCGVTPGAITQRKNCSIKKLKEILEKT